MERIGHSIFPFLVALASLSSFIELRAEEGPSMEVLSEQRWAEVDESVEKGLNWLARQQQPDGSFPTLPNGQPGVTGLCVLAFLAHGHTPDSEPYGEVIEKAVTYIAERQKPNGLIALIAPTGDEITRNVSRTVGETVTYNHGIAGVALGEAYSLTGGTTADEIKEVLEKGIEATLTMQNWQKERPVDQGGWRYLDLLDRDGEAVDSNLSNTVWQMLFLRSAKNAGFDVPQQSIDDAVVFIKNCYHPDYGTFVLMPSHYDHRTRGMSGAGVVSLALAGMHDSEEARTAGDWILENGFEKYNVVEPFGQTGFLDDRYHYGVFFCTQATYQLGGHYWENFFPRIVDVVLKNQRPEGSWEAERHSNDYKFGNTHTTAMMLLALGAPNQLLPVLQR
jgi:prenyltransferase beta subunit